MMRQGLEDEIKYSNKEMAEAKKTLATSGESQAAAEGDLGVTSKELAADVKDKAGLHHECMTKAEDFEAATKSRGEELKALNEAKKVLAETTSGAGSISYSFIQQSTQTGWAISTSTDLANFEAVRLVRDLARKEKSPALAQLAQRMATAIRAGHTSADTFGKVKDLIRDMISKLESEADADATEKAWCDRNLADAREKKSDKTAEIEKISTRIDAISSQSAKLKEEIADLQAGLAKIASSQAKMNKVRSEEHEAFVSDKADMEKGLEGVKTALKVLGEYYASEDKDHSAAMGAGQGIIGLLEVVESDLSKSLDKDSAELTSDRSTVQAELDATNEYLSKLEGRCVAKAESYAERKARSEAEIAGLKQALDILENETALLQKKVKKARHLRAHLSA